MSVKGVTGGNPCRHIMREGDRKLPTSGGEFDWEEIDSVTAAKTATFSAESPVIPR
jgi:hypothetical protein